MCPSLAAAGSHEERPPGPGEGTARTPTARLPVQPQFPLWRVMPCCVKGAEVYGFTSLYWSGQGRKRLEARATLG